jgi:multiple sugar transport system substrate-binding protein
VNRRQFVRGSLLLGGAMLAAACSAPAAPPAPTAAPKPAESKPAEAARPAADARPAEAARPSAPAAAPAATAAPASGGSTSPASSSGGKYKLDLGGYKGPVPTDKPVQLKFTRQTFAPNVEQWWKDVYAEWATAYPNITVQEETVPYGDLQQKLQTYVASGDTPDLIMGRGDFVDSYVFNNIALDLSQFLTDDFLSDLLPSIKAQHTVGGKLYAWPWETNNIVMYFNRELWEKAGVPTPPESTDIGQAWTWEQYIEAWKTIVTKLNPSGEPSVYALSASEYGNGGPGSNYWYEGVYARSEGDPNAPKDSSAYKTFAGVSEDGTVVSGYIDTPEAVKGMTNYQTLFKEKLTPSVAQPRMFEDQKAATRFGGLGHFFRFNNPETGIKFKWGAAAVPKGKISMTHTTGDSPIILAKSKYPAEAAALMAFCCNDKNRLTWHKVWGNPPARTSLFDKMGYSDPIQQISINEIKAGYAPPKTPGFLEYFSAMNTAVKDIALGAAVEDRLKKASKEIDGLLAPYKK